MEIADPTPESVRSARHAGIWAGALVLIAQILLTLLGQTPKRVAFDALLYHVPTIHQFQQQLPDVDLYDYLSATTPGYHLALALLAPNGASSTTLGLMGGGFTAAFAAILAWACALRCSSVVGGLGLSILVWLSPYVAWAGIAPLPDNTGWLLGLLLVLMSSRLTRNWSNQVLWGCGAIFVLLILTRQSHAWIAGVLVVSALRSTHKLSGKISRVSTTALSLVLGITLLWGFIKLWDGLVPPRFQGQYAAKQFSDYVRSPALAFTLATFGSFAPFTLAWTLPTLWHWWHERRGLVLAVLAGACCLAMIPATTHDFDAGRRTGLWNLAAKFPSFGHASLLMVGLAVVGALSLVLLLARARPGDRWVLGWSVLGFATAMSASNEVWQRYVEPLVLMVIVLCIAGAAGRARTRPEEHRWIRRGRVLGPVLLGLALLSVSVVSVARNPWSLRGPQPASRDPVHRGGVPPVELPRFERPDDRTLWRPWAPRAANDGARRKEVR